jgi:hypothetical protein
MHEYPDLPRITIGGVVIQNTMVLVKEPVFLLSQRAPFEAGRHYSKPRVG